MKLDYSIESPEERLALVQQILSENPSPGHKYLETLSDYLIMCMEKQERKKKKILTENRLYTVNKRETSFEGLVSRFETGEDGVYNLIKEDKNVKLCPKISITKQNLAEIPFMQQTREAVAFWEHLARKLTGRQAYIAKKSAIDLRKVQYIIKTAYLKPIKPTHLVMSKPVVYLPETVEISSNGAIAHEGVTLLSKKVCSAILCNYSKLKADSYDNFLNDTWYLMQDFDRISSHALKPYPIYEAIITYKIDGKRNDQIQIALQEEFGIYHSIEYISSLWRNKIPNLIAKAAEDEYLSWYFLSQEKGKYKKCTRCGQIKLALPKYFSRNSTSKDGFYSLCKSCRSRRRG